MSVLGEIMSESPQYELFADDESVWCATRRPTQTDVDRAAAGANARGWNGTSLELYCDGVWRQLMQPSEDVLS